MMVSVEDVSKRYGTIEALSGVSFTVAPGEFVAVIGASGAGKSTLLRSINGLVKPDRGQVRLNGQELTPRLLRRARQKIGMVFQGFNLIKELTVFENVLIGRLGYKPLLGLRFNREDREIALRALEEVGLADRAWQYPSALSGGMRQRVGIARALAQEPAIILADEPVASLDPVTAREIMDILQRLNYERGVTIICNLHQVELARAYATRVLGLYQGRLVFDGPAAALQPDVANAVYRGIA